MPFQMQNIVTLKMCCLGTVHKRVPPRCVTESGSCRHHGWADEMDRSELSIELGKRLDMRPCN